MQHGDAPELLVPGSGVDQSVPHSSMAHVSKRPTLHFETWLHPALALSQALASWSRQLSYLGVLWVAPKSARQRHPDVLCLAMPVSPTMFFCIRGSRFCVERGLPWGTVRLSSPQRALRTPNTP